MALQKIGKSSTVSRGYVLYLPDTYDAAKKYPVVILFPGIGQGGDGTDAGLQNVFDLINSKWYPFVAQLQKRGVVLVAMQQPWGSNWKLSDVDEALVIASKYSVDFNAVHLTGLSLGGQVVWGYPASSLANGSKFSSITPVCAVQGISGNYTNIKSPVFAFHAQDDGVVSVQNTNGIVDSINGANPPVSAKKKIFPSGGHEIWGTVYGSDEYWDWVMVQYRGGVVNPPPTMPTTTKKLLFTIKVYDDGSTEKV